MNSAALEYRHSYVSPPMSHSASLTIVQRQSAYADLLKHQQMERPAPAPLPARPPPVQQPFQHDRSLPTNVLDHPTAIQVNGLRQQATPLAHWSGYVAGVNTYNEGVLCGNWEESRQVPGPEPRGSVIPTANARNWSSTTHDASKWLGDFRSAGAPKLGAHDMYETTQQAAAKAATQPQPQADHFRRKGFDLEAYRRDWTIGTETSRVRGSTTENRVQFKPHPDAALTTGFPKVSGAPRARARQHCQRGLPDLVPPAPHARLRRIAPDTPACGSSARRTVEAGGLALADMRLSYVGGGRTRDSLITEMLLVTRDGTKVRASSTEA